MINFGGYKKKKRKSIRSKTSKFTEFTTTRVQIPQDSKSSIQIPEIQEIPQDSRRMSRSQDSTQDSKSRFLPFCTRFLVVAYPSAKSISKYFHFEILFFDQCAGTT